MKAKMPRDGQTVQTSMGVARVVGSNPLKETVIVELETQVTVELPWTDVKVIPKPAFIQPEPPIAIKPEPIRNQEIKEPKETIIPPEEKDKPPLQ
jgi:cell fate regulator YaaT (PSP1 superfamily)